MENQSHVGGSIPKTHENSNETKKNFNLYAMSFWQVKKKDV